MQLVPLRDIFKTTLSGALGRPIKHAILWQLIFSLSGCNEQSAFTPI